jgi:uncharacterized protein YqhQ
VTDERSEIEAAEAAEPTSGQVAGQAVAVAPAAVEPEPELTDAEIEALASRPATHTHIGGQALIEGVMMRGRVNWAVAVRTADGAIHVEEHDLPGGAKTGWKAWPIARGVWAMYETLALAMRAFGIAASLAGETEEEQLTASEIGTTMVLGVVIAVAVFIVLPAVLTNLVVNSLKDPILWNVADGVLRLVVFFLYIWGVGLVPDIRRVFAYHGAEHKSIHAYEHGLPLKPRYVQRFETLHVRCGTSFLLMVMVIAILVFSAVPGKLILGSLLGAAPAAWAVVTFNILVRIVLLPLVAGLAYEITVKWAGSRSENPFVKVLLWPGMQLQRMTTREPDDGMVEVAVAALKAVADREAREADLPAPAPAPAPAAEPELT